MPDIQVTMDASGPTADVPTGSKAQLNLPAGSSPASWTQNDVVWAAPSAPVLVDPSIGGDDVYKVVDQNGTALSAVVRWKPNPPDNVTLTPGKDNTSVTWDAIGDESKISYYQVDLDPRPSGAQLPRKVMVGASPAGTKRALSLQGLPPNSYTATVFAVRDGNGGPVSSEPATSSSGTVLPASGPYSGPVRILLAIIGLAAVGGAVYLLVTSPRSNNKIDLNGWALGIAVLVTLALFLLLSVIVRIRDLLTGADNRISTSRVNVGLWTVAIAFGITTLAVFAFGAHQYHMVNPCGLKTSAKGKAPAGAGVNGICVNGNAIDAAQLGLDHTFKGGLAPNYLVLLGAPFVALAGSAFIVNQQVGNGSRQKVQSAGPSSYVDALTDDDGSADLVDSQYLIFTGVLLFYFLISFIPNPSVLPDLPWGLVGLTGVSAGTYLLNKSVATNGLTVQGLASSSVKQGGSARVLGLNFLPEGSAGLVNGGVSISLNGSNPTITEVSNTDVTFTVNAPRGTYNVQLTTAANVSGSAGSLQVT
jgi:hypothetical protein